MKPGILEEFHPLFYPRSIAVVGASPEEFKMGTRYLKALLEAGFQGPLYAVNIVGDSSLGIPIYRDLRAIPGSVDYVIVCIPAREVPGLLDQCAAKGVKAVQFFTAGFREVGTEEGRRLEEVVVRKAREGGFRIIGPNCIGVHNPSHRMPYGIISNMGPPGSVAIVSQSGGNANRLVEVGVLRGICYSKVVSFGNGCDLDSPDYLEYFLADPETKIVGSYLEGVRDGRRFFQVAQELCRVKPLVVWKGGRTEEGAQAAHSHTGSLASPYRLWDGLLRQVGAVKAENVEELADTLLALQGLSPFSGRRVGVIAGIAGGGGGETVSSTDTCISAGLEVPPFSAHIRRRLQEFIPPAGAIFRNPLDMSATRNVYQDLPRALEIILEDPVIELVIVNLNVDNIVLRSGDGERLSHFLQAFIKLRKGQPKPLALVLPPGRADIERKEAEQRLAEENIPAFPSLDRAAKAIHRATEYWRWREGR